MKKKCILLFSLLIFLGVELSINTKSRSKQVIIKSNNYKTENMTITSDKYLIEKPYIKWLSTRTIKDNFTEDLMVTDGMPVLKCDNNTNYVGTGCKIYLTESTGESSSTIYNPVVFGDVTGDGESTITDMVKIATYANKNIGLETEPQKLAADINLDNNISLNDSSVLAFYSLQGLPTPPPSYNVEHKNTIVVPKNKITIEVNKSIKIEAKTNQSDISITNWISQDESIATVDSNGTVTGKKDGTTIVTITASNGESLDIEVTVKSSISPTGIILNATNVNLTINGSTSLIATISPSNVTNKQVVWTSSNPAVAKVDAIGRITAVGAGEATITVTTQDGNHRATCHVVVTIPVTKVEIANAPSTMVRENCIQLQAKVTPSNASNPAVTWTSSNANILRIESNGKVCALNGGTATITVKTVDKGYTASASIKVIVPVTNIDLSSTNATLMVGKTKQLKATVRPLDATNQKVTWTSSDEKVATVNQKGEVTAVSGGTAKITVTSNASKSIKATCTVTVKTGYMILINPSHQPSNETSLKTPGYQNEKESMYKLANKLKKKLENNGYDVYLAQKDGNIDPGDQCWTKSENNFSTCGPKQARVAIKSENKNGKNLYIALHSNASNGKGVGPYVFYASGQSGSQKFAKRLCTSLTNVYKNNGLSAGLGSADNCAQTSSKVGEPRMYYSNGGTGQAVLIEVGFHDNPTNQAFIENKTTSQKLVNGMIRAINTYIAKDVK